MATGASLQTDHFAESGRFFYEMIELSKMRIPTVCVVFGSSTAGGAYQPGLSDYTIMVKDQSKMFLGGPPLVKMATGEISDDETLGGAEMHTTVSGGGDYFAQDEMDALRMCREVISHLNIRKAGPEPSFPPDPPVYDPDELLGIVSRDLVKPVDVRDIIARTVDGSRFEEFKPRWGSTLVCGWASIHGYPLGIIGNNGVLYPDAAQKGAHFIQLCNQIDVPLWFLQNITGYMVGKDFEARRDHQEGFTDAQRGHQLDRAAHHRDRRLQLRCGDLRHVGPGIREPFHLPVAHCEDCGDGPQTDCGRDV